LDPFDDPTRFVIEGRQAISDLIIEVANLRQQESAYQASSEAVLGAANRAHLAGYELTLAKIGHSISRSETDIVQLKHLVRRAERAGLNAEQAVAEEVDKHIRLLCTVGANADISQRQQPTIVIRRDSNCVYLFKL
jgi:hypothetical protein